MADQDYPAFCSVVTLEEWQGRCGARITQCLQEIWLEVRYISFSPWDRNAECYGQGDAYNRFFIEQLTELLTNYGEVHEVWFDGANGEGPNGKKQIYDWEAIERTIRRLQPKAVTAVMGDDVRWVGNEKGIGRKTEWSATVLTLVFIPVP